MTMDCDDHRAEISALADGEGPTIDPRALQDHLASCRGCADFAAQVDDQRRRSRMVDATSARDLSADVVRRTADLDRKAGIPIVRWLLALVAVQIVVLAVPDLFADGDAGHSARHLGAFSLAYAAGLIVVVVRPARARTMLNVAFVLAAAMAVTTVVDVMQGRVPLVNETVHIPELFSVVFLWLLARPKQAMEDAAPTAPTGADGRDNVTDLSARRRSG